MAVLVLLSLIAGLWTVFAFVGTALGWFLAGTLVGSLCSAFQKHQVQEQTRRNIAAAIDAAAERGRAEGWKEGLARGRELGREQGELDGYLAARRRMRDEMVGPCGPREEPDPDDPFPPGPFRLTDPVPGHTPEVDPQSDED
jgi:hypothetical protein